MSTFRFAAHPMFGPLVQTVGSITIVTAVDTYTMQSLQLIAAGPDRLVRTAGGSVCAANASGWSHRPQTKAFIEWAERQLPNG